MKKIANNYGFVPSKITEEQWKLGQAQVPYVIQKKDGNWFADRPSKEIQNTIFDTYNCTGFNTLAAIECYMKGVFGETVNYSDRFLGIVAGTQPPGNDPQTVFEAIRKYGLVPDEMLPYSSDLKNTDEYYSYKGGNKEACLAEGRKWLEKHNFLHDWVIAPDDDLTTEEREKYMRMALLSSPLPLAVYAWAQDDKGVYIKLGDENHWTFQYAQDTLGRVEDSYEPTLKDIMQNIRYCKRIYIEKRTTPVKKSWLQRLLELIFSFFK